jgi:alkylation response protein AidB-like acyl-CoA dehydrogenase
VQFRYDPEHEALRESVRRFLAEVDVDLAGKRLATELGVFGLAIPEQYGGAGAGLTELGIVFHEAGRALLDAPLLPAAIATASLLSVGDDTAAAEWLPRIASGEIIVTAAGRDDGVPASASAGRNGRWHVNAAKSWVFDGEAADVLLVTAGTDGGGALFLVDPAGDGVQIEPLTTVDITRRFARIRFIDAPARLVGDVGALPRTMRPVHNTMLVLLAAEQTGIAERVLEMATEYAKTREQFGRPIGSFQAVKHKLASVQLELEAAVAAEMFALWTADHDVDNLDRVARIAAYTCGEAAQIACSENIQVHGGIGATWEHPAHRYLRRAHVDRMLLSEPQHHLEALAAMVSDVTPSG